jgi:hypothetical protein
MDPGTVVGTAIGVATGLAVPGTIAVLRILPGLMSKAPTNGTNGDSKLYESVRRAVGDQLEPLLARQTTILEKMQDTLVDNTMALQIFMKLEEQRERLGKPGSVQG